MDRLMTRAEVEEAVGVSRSTIYELMRRDQFPRPLKIGPRNVRWVENEVAAWLQSRPRSNGDLPQ